jgi:uncharacterized protein YbjT (DUF2867 family)
MLNNRIVTVFGGSGFIGRRIIKMLAVDGYTIRVASRTPDSCYELRTMGAPGQVVPSFFDPARPETIGAAITGSCAVINCMGILFERGKATFHAAHAELPRQLATSAKRHNVDHFVHISALGVDQSKSRYAKSKLAGEQAVFDNFPSATILRPSVVFGPGDNFFNMFATLAKYLPFLPLIGGGKTRFQPVYVDDIAAAVAEVLRRAPVGGVQDPRGRIYELGGPEILTFCQIYERLFVFTGQRRTLITLPWGLARIQAGFMQMLPKPMLTIDQVKSLQTDNVVSPTAQTFKNLGISSTALDVILPTYLDRFRPGGRFAELKQRA